MPHRITRRTVLRAAGAAVALPFLDAMLPRLQSAPSTFKPWAAASLCVQTRKLTVWQELHFFSLIQSVPTFSR